MVPGWSWWLQSHETASRLVNHACSVEGQACPHRHGHHCREDRHQDEGVVSAVSDEAVWSGSPGVPAALRTTIACSTGVVNRRVGAVTWIAAARARRAAAPQSTSNRRTRTRRAPPSPLSRFMPAGGGGSMRIVLGAPTTACVCARRDEPDPLCSPKYPDTMEHAPNTAVKI